MAKTSTKPKSATSYKDTAFGILPRSRVITLEAEGIKKAQEYILKVSDKKTVITPQLILDLHKEGFGFIFPQWAGKFRTIEVTVGDYDPPHYTRIPELVTNFCNDLGQAILDGRNVNQVALTCRNHNNPSLPLRRIIKCGKCGKGLTGGKSKGNGGTYYYYHCGGSCKSKSVRPQVLENALMQVLKESTPSRECLNLFINFIYKAYYERYARFIQERV